MTGTECASCPEGMPRGECEESRRPCGHHCNCSWDQDICHWCGAEFGEDGAESTAADKVEEFLREMEREPVS